MAIHGQWKLYQKSSMKLKDIHNFLKDLFHGNTKTGVVSQVHLVVNGLPPYDKLYNKQTEIIVSGTVDSTSSGVSLVLKPDLAQSESVFIAGRDITRSVLEKTTFTNNSLMRGRKLFNDGNGALKNIRKALALLKELPEVTFVDDEIMYRSGVTPDEVKVKLLDAMHLHLKGKTSVDESEQMKKKGGTDENSSEVEVEEAEEPPAIRPAGWMFQGWMAFVLFGPFAEKKDRLDLLYCGIHENDGKKQLSSRRALRREEAAAKDAQRLANVDKRNGDASRGIPLPSQINMAALQVKKKELDMRQLEWKNQRRNAVLLNMHLQLQNLNRTLDRAEARAKNFTTGYDPNHILWQAVIDHENTIKEYNDKINKFVSEGALELEMCEKRNKRKQPDDYVIELDNVVMPPPAATTPTPPSSMPREIAISIDDDGKSSSDFEDSTTRNLNNGGAYEMV
jgi:hypothetical protein